ncbi:alpha/beta hydrolase [Reyranella sp.]|uniref:alpha/beta hydrolase n=1 Tax=Reyranella sp. TaxID=1929291 RepID=UPI003D0A27E0
MRKPLCLALFLLAAVSGGAHAEPVQIKPGLQRLNGNLELPAGKTAADGVVLIVHGTLSWHGQETIATLQKNLKARGVGSLAITLSLGVDDRQRTRQCDVVHDYAIAGAKREVGLWLEWLAGQGARTVDLLGFSRGGAQVASFAPELARARRVVLLAPAFATADEQAEIYQRAFGHPLAPEIEAARKQPLQKRTIDFLTCKQAPVLNATFLDGYAEVRPSLAAKTGHPTLVVVAGKDEVVPDLSAKLPSEVKPVVIDGASHFFLDLYGEEAADAIASFLKKE